MYYLTPPPPTFWSVMYYLTPPPPTFWSVMYYLTLPPLKKIWSVMYYLTLPPPLPKFWSVMYYLTLHLPPPPLLVPVTCLNMLWFKHLSHAIGPFSPETHHFPSQTVRKNRAGFTWSQASRDVCACLYAMVHAGKVDICRPKSLTPNLAI